MNWDRGRPENQLPAELYYNENQARKYSTSSRIIAIQRQMSERALELLNLPKDSTPLILDVGCGSGISGEVLTQSGHHWIGIDISQPMLDVANEKKKTRLGDLILNDMGHGLPFQTGTFDGCMSISALQWLCTIYKKSENPFHRIKALFQSLYRCLKQGGKAVFQFYPENSQQSNYFLRGATAAGFHGGVVIDYPNSAKARKYYLVLFAGVAPPSERPEPLLGEGDEMEIKKKEDKIRMFKRESSFHPSRKKRYVKKSRLQLKEYIVRKKVRDRFRGRKTATDSKYTGRSRRRW